MASCHLYSIYVTACGLLLTPGHYHLRAILISSGPTGFQCLHIWCWINSLIKPANFSGESHAFLKGNQLNLPMPVLVPCWFCCCWCWLFLCLWLLLIVDVVSPALLEKSSCRPVDSPYAFYRSLFSQGLRVKSVRMPGIEVSACSCYGMALVAVVTTFPCLEFEVKKLWVWGNSWCYLLFLSSMVGRWYFVEGEGHSIRNYTFCSRYMGLSK